jgi:hypothetical protein
MNIGFPLDWCNCFENISLFNVKKFRNFVLGGEGGGDEKQQMDDL